MHVGIVSSSLGSRGGDVCPDSTTNPANPALSAHDNDNGELIARTGVAGNPTIENTIGDAPSPLNFLSYFPSVAANQGKPTPPTPPVTSPDTLVSDFTSLIEGVHEHGCGFEAQNEAWYRFLVQPDPFATVNVANNVATVSGIDETILKQRADFLRPDSLVAVVVVTDENEEAVDPLTVEGQGWAFDKGSFPGSQSGGGAPEGTIECQQLDPNNPSTTGPNSPQCQSCAFVSSSDPNFATECPRDGTNGNDGFLDPANDSPNLRFFHQKERFGLFAGYPTSRYVRGLQKLTVPSVGLAYHGDADHEHDANGNYIGDEDAQADCVNPLFAKNLPTSASQDLCHLTPGPRSPNLVYYAAIAGVPHELLQATPGGTGPGETDASGNPLCASGTPAEQCPQKSTLQAADWRLIKGNDPEHYDFSGADFHMVESIGPRTKNTGNWANVAVCVPPASGTPPAPGAAGADSINGCEFNTNNSDLQFSCVFPLVQVDGSGTIQAFVKDCTDTILRQRLRLHPELARQGLAALLVHDPDQPAVGQGLPVRARDDHRPGHEQRDHQRRAVQPGHRLEPLPHRARHRPTSDDRAAGPPVRIQPGHQCAHRAREALDPIARSVALRGRARSRYARGHALLAAPLHGLPRRHPGVLEQQRSVRGRPGRFCAARGRREHGALHLGRRDVRALHDDVPGPAAEPDPVRRLGAALLPAAGRRRHVHSARTRLGQRLDGRGPRGRRRLTRERPGTGETHLRAPSEARCTTSLQPCHPPSEESFAPGRDCLSPGPGRSMHSPAMSKLLLVDADPLSLRVLDVSLRKAGFEVVTASDGEGALAKLGTSAPDLLVTDTRLRESDGFSLAKSLREREGAADLPVIFLSIAESPEERAQAAALGVDDVMGKPVFVRELVARVQLLLARRVQGSVASGPVTGTTGELALVDLLQSLEAAHTTGVIELDHESTTARIYMREGNVVDAELGRLRGAEVVFRALGWEKVSFRVQPGPVDNDDLLECTTHALLLRAMDRLDGLTPEVPTVLVTEPELSRVPAPDPEAEPAAGPVLHTGPGASARERSVPSTAPWTREAEPSAAPTHEADLHAAGVPAARTRTMRRAALYAAAAGAALVVVIGLRSAHVRQLQESERARAQLPTTSAAAAAAGPSQPLEPGASPLTATGGTGPVAEQATAAPASTDAATTPDTVTGPDGLPVTAAVAPAAPAVDPRETALDVKTSLHARSALVRDAQSALLKGDTGKAMALAQQAALTSPYDAEGWLTLAAARKAAGDLGGARDAYAQCVSKAHTVGVMSCRALAARGE